MNLPIAQLARTISDKQRQMCLQIPADLVGLGRIFVNYEMSLAHERTTKVSSFECDWRRERAKRSVR